VSEQEMMDRAEEALKTLASNPQKVANTIMGLYVGQAEQKARAERAEAALRVAVKALTEAVYSPVPLDYSDMEAAIEQARAVLPTTEKEDGDIATTGRGDATTQEVEALDGE
jgi:hypothetical protein